MKKSFLALLIPALISGCLPVSPKKTISESSSGSSHITTSESSSSSSQSTTKTSGSSGGQSSSGSSGSTSEDIPIDPSDVPPTDLQKSTISQIKTNANDGDWVKFDATYLTPFTWFRSNEDLMYFADDANWIYLHLSYAEYTTHLQKLYTMKEYTVTGKVKVVDGAKEIIRGGGYTDKQTVVSLGDTATTSYNSNTTPISVTGINEIKAKAGQITQNKKGYGVGELVKFTSQVVQTQKGDANKKAMVLDSDGNTITVISEKKLVGDTDWGKYYTWYGIISYELTIPAIWGLSCSYVSHTTEEEKTVDVTNATEVAPSYFKKWNLTSDYWTPASTDDYFKLYKATGYVADNTDITGSYNFGMVDTYGASLSDQGNRRAVAGFYILDCQGLDEDDLQYCPVTEYVNVNTPITVYFSIRHFDTNNHIWNMMVITDLIEEA